MFQVTGTKIKWVENGRVRTASRYDLPLGNPYRLVRRPGQLPTLAPQHRRRRRIDAEAAVLMIEGEQE